LPVHVLAVPIEVGAVHGEHAAGGGALSVLRAFEHSPAPGVMADRLYTQATRELIGVSLELVPPRVLDRIGGVRFHEGVYGRSWGGVLPDCYVEDYRTRGSSFFSSPQPHQEGMLRAQREPTIALHPWAGVDTVLHELGHALWFAAIEPHRRWRVYWDPGRGRVDVREASGLMPAAMPFTDYEARNYMEQFAEAFALWLLPRERPHRRDRGGAVQRFYLASPFWTVDHWGWRLDNRRLLAFLNELAGWPGDRAPCALR
jgi:hypothetical protein